MASTSSRESNAHKSSSSSASSSELDYERVLLVKPAVHVHRIPPLLSASRGFRASDWNLAEPDFTCRLRLVSKGRGLFLRLEDQKSGELCGQAPVTAFPGTQVQPVADSRRYFVIKVVSDTGQSALLGIGFADGADSFDLNVALQDYFTALKHESDPNKRANNEPLKLDLALKGDIKMNLNINGLRKTSREEISTKPKPISAPVDPSKPFVLLPPPSSTRRRQ